MSKAQSPMSKVVTRNSRPRLSNFGLKTSDLGLKILDLIDPPHPTLG